MAYALYSDVQEKIHHLIINATSNPTTTEVTEYIAQKEAEMDARFKAAGVTVVPITGSDLLIVVKQIIINGVLAEIYRSLETEGETSDRYQKLYEDAMKNIEKHPNILEVSQVVVSPGYNQDCYDAKRVFKKDERTW